VQIRFLYLDIFKVYRNVFTSGCFMFALITCSTVVLQCATSHFYGARRNSTLRNLNVLTGPMITKPGMIDYVGDPYLYANFS